LTNSTAFCQNLRATFELVAHLNLASRLEGLTRLFPLHPILISASVLALLPGQLEVEPLGAHPLKGWPEPVEVFGLIGLRA
jgi:adenylate cyclase